MELILLSMHTILRVVAKDSPCWKQMPQRMAIIFSIRSQFVAVIVQMRQYGIIMMMDDNS